MEKDKLTGLIGLLFLSAALAGCSTTQTRGASPRGAVILFPPAVIKKEHVDCAIAIEHAMDAGATRQAGANEAWFIVRKGSSRVLVTAPHATEPMREGKQRFADRGTGGLAALLYEVAGTTTLSTILASPSDPNYYDDNEFKRTLAKLVSEQHPVLVLDLHASHGFRPYDVDFGTLGGTSVLGQRALFERLSALLRGEGLTNQSQDYFAASKNATVAKFVSGLGTPVLQLEFSATYTAPGQGDIEGHRFAQLLQALVRFIGEVDAGKIPGIGDGSVASATAPNPSVCAAGAE
jgi:hypothetical protein